MIDTSRFAFVTLIMAAIMLATIWFDFFAHGQKRQLKNARLSLLLWGIGFLAFLVACRFPNSEASMFGFAFIGWVAFLSVAMQTNVALQPKSEAQA